MITEKYKFYVSTGYGCEQYDIMFLEFSGEETAEDKESMLSEMHEEWMYNSGYLDFGWIKE